MELDPKSVFSDEIVVPLFSGSTRRSSGCGQILDDEPQLGPREPFFFTNANRAGADICSAL